MLPRPRSLFLEVHGLIKIHPIPVWEATVKVRDVKCMKPLSIL
jgi:hypothetical protein